MSSNTTRSSSAHTSANTSSSSAQDSSSRALQNGASGAPFNVGIVIAIIIGGIVLFGGLIWLSNKQRDRWAAHEHRKEYEVADKKGSLPTYADTFKDAPSSSLSSEAPKTKGQKPLLLPSAREAAARDRMRMMEEGRLPAMVEARPAPALSRPPRSYDQTPGRLQPFQGL